MKEIYNALATEFATSAREYFMVLRLVIYHMTSYYAEGSVDVMKYLEGADNGEKIYELACEVLKVLNKKGEEMGDYIHKCELCGKTFDLYKGEGWGESYMKEGTMLPSTRYVCMECINKRKENNK